MHVFHSAVMVKPGREAEYDALAHRYRDNVKSAPGFLRRLLLKDKETPGRYFFMAFWESFEQLRAFREAEATRATVGELDAADLIAGAVGRVECE